MGTYLIVDNAGDSLAVGRIDDLGTGTRLQIARDGQIVLDERLPSAPCALSMLRGWSLALDATATDKDTGIVVQLDVDQTDPRD